MNTDFEPIVAAAVQQAKARQSLIWADLLACRIVESTPIPARRAEIAELVAREAVRQGAPVKMPRKRRGVLERSPFGLADQDRA